MSSCLFLIGIFNKKYDEKRVGGNIEMKKYDNPEIDIFEIVPKDILVSSGDVTDQENVYDASGKSDWFVGE